MLITSRYDNAALDNFEKLTAQGDYQPVIVSAPNAAYAPNEGGDWHRNEPSQLIFITYACVVPVFSCFGIFANFINAIVFMRPKMSPSAFSYLAALSWLDCISCVLITLTAFSRSIFYGSTAWVVYDFMWQTPLFGTTTGAANLILACVSLDRLIYLCYGMQHCGQPPRFCQRKVARRMIAGILLISTVVNLPYYFVFVVNEDGSFHTTPFYASRRYRFCNWFTFVLLTLLPAVFLLVGNAAIIVAFRRFTKQSKLCAKNSPECAKLTKKRFQHQMKLTITVLIVITLYLFGELPAHLCSRKSALNLIFGGDVSKVNLHVMENVELLFMTLNALQLSLNILVYGLINPSFMPEFFSCLRSASDICFRYLGCKPICDCTRKMLSGCKEAKNHKEPTAVRTQSHSNSWGLEPISENIPKRKSELLLSPKQLDCKQYLCQNSVTSQLAT